MPGPELHHNGALGPVSALGGRQKLGPLGKASNGKDVCVGQGFAPRCERG